jgi:cell division initiation protein
MLFKSEEVAQVIETRRLPSPARKADRNLAVTPIDLRQAKFTTAMRGFDRTEVTSLLEEAAEGYDEALRENERLRQEIGRLDGSLAQYRQIEESLKTMLVSAQKHAEETRENATRDAAQIVRDAEARAEAIMEKAQTRFDDVLREIEALRLKRREAETNIEATIFALRGTLDFVRESEPSRDLSSFMPEKVVAHRPREIAAPATINVTPTVVSVTNPVPAAQSA